MIRVLTLSKTIVNGITWSMIRSWMIRVLTLSNNNPQCNHLTKHATFTTTKNCRTIHCQCHSSKVWLTTATGICKYLLGKNSLGFLSPYLPYILPPTLYFPRPNFRGKWSYIFYHLYIIISYSHVKPHISFNSQKWVKT